MTTIDRTVRPGDYRRAHAFLAAYATNDLLGEGVVQREAVELHRGWHFIAAFCELIMVGSGLDSDPEKIHQVREAIAKWADLEAKETQE